MASSDTTTVVKRSREEDDPRVLAARSKLFKLSPGDPFMERPGIEAEAGQSIDTPDVEHLPPLPTVFSAGRLYAGFKQAIEDRVANLTLQINPAVGTHTRFVMYLGRVVNRVVKKDNWFLAFVSDNRLCWVDRKGGNAKTVLSSPESYLGDGGGTLMPTEADDALRKVYMVYTMRCITRIVAILKGLFPPDRDASTNTHVCKMLKMFVESDRSGTDTVLERVKKSLIGDSRHSGV